jgi:hypothetical protein
MTSLQPDAQDFRPPETALPARRRSEALAAFLIGATVLALSVLLQPDPRGFGTHEQLLMPPCLFRLITHVPCPFCGMTTGFALMARGKVWQAAADNLMAPPAFFLTALITLAGLWGLLTGREWIPASTRGGRYLRPLLAIIGLFWIANLINQMVLK